MDKDEKRFVTPYGLQLQDDEDIGKYEQTVKVVTLQKEWAHQPYNHNPTCGQSETNESEMNEGWSSYNNKALYNPAEKMYANESWRRSKSWWQAHIEPSAEPNKDGKVWKWDTHRESSRMCKNNARHNPIPCCTT